MKKKRHLTGEDETLDSFYHGRILIIQKKRGYRFSLDAPLLADFIRTKKSDTLLDLGAGNGVISLLLSLKPFRRIVCLEIQESLVDLARRNVEINRLGDRITVLQEDLRTYRPDEKFDLIFSNPPYIRAKAGYLSRSEEKSIAKHEIKCDILDIMKVTAELLKEEGRACFIYAARRQKDFARAMERNRLKFRILRYVHPREHSPALWFLAECAFLPSDVRILPPLILYEESGAYTPEVKMIFRGARSG